MITRWIKIIDVQATFIGGLKALFHFQVEHLESQFLRFSDFLRVRRDLDVKIRHFYERNTHPLVVKLNGVGRGAPGVARKQHRQSAKSNLNQDRSEEHTSELQSLTNL